MTQQIRNSFGIASGITLLFFTLITLSTLALALPRPEKGIRPESIFLSDNKKTEAYIREGMFTGGDRAIGQAEVQGVRFSSNPLFERMVLDLKILQEGIAPDLQRPPYFQVAISPKTHQVVITLWGNPRLAFDAKKAMASAQKVALIKQFKLFPRLEDNSWTFALDLKADAGVEVFELTNPVRVIVDIQKKKK